jgi:hypothetical protein
LAIWDRLRRRQAPSSSASFAGTCNPSTSATTQAFAHILWAARKIESTSNMVRSDPSFDRHLGTLLAERCLERCDKPDILRMMTAVLLSHCGYDAALIFVLKLIDESCHFGITVGPDIIIACEVMSDRLCGSADIYSMAADCAKRSDLQKAGPFRGPAQLLWEAGYSGVSRSNASVAGAADALVRRVAQTWSLQPPPEPVSPVHAIAMPIRS